MPHSVKHTIANPLQSTVLRCGLAMLVSVVFLLFVPVGAVKAVPVAPDKVSLTQPDGTVIVVSPFGDEWYSGYEYEGFTIVQDNTSGYWVYAERDRTGALSPGQTKVGIEKPQIELLPHLRDALALPGMIDKNSIYSLEGWPGAAGSHKVLVILVDFLTSTSLGTTDAAWSATFFDNTSGAKSVKNWYEEASFGNFTLSPVVENVGTENDGIIAVTMPYDNPYPWPDETERTTVRKALEAVDPDVDFSALDTNGDGSLDVTELHLVLIVRGFEESYGGTGGACTPNVWGHRWSMPVGTCAHCAPELDGVIVGALAYNGGYMWEGEWHERDLIEDPGPQVPCGSDPGGHMATMGILVHELGHDIDWPDLYDTNPNDGSNSAGVGYWSIMASGSWGLALGDAYSGMTPVLPDAFLKWYQGWITPVPVTAPQANVPIANAKENPVAYILGANPGDIDWDFQDTSGTGEYFLIENRQQIGFDSGLRRMGTTANGCVIWHIDETRTSANTANANPTRKLVDLEEADGPPQDMDLSTGGNSGDSGDPWPGVTGETVFNAASDPNSNWYDGSASGIAITNISSSGEGCTVDFSGVGQVWSGSVNSNWDTAGNWTTGRVPNPIDNVIIPSGVSNWPNITTAASAGNLVILDGAQVTANTDAVFDVYGDWLEAGSSSFTASAGTVTFRGSYPQSITSGINSYFNHMNLGDGSATPTVNSSSNLDVNGDLTIGLGASLVAGSYTLRVGGNFIDNPLGLVPGNSTVILDGTTSVLQRAATEVTVYSNNLSSTSGWVTYDANAGGYWIFTTSTVAPNSPDHGIHARYIYNESIPGDDWLFAPGFTLQAGVTYNIRFNYGAYFATWPEKLAVHIGTAHNVGAMTTQIFDNNNVIHATWQQGSGTFTPGTSGIYYVGFHCYSDADMAYLAIDDFEVVAIDPNLAFYNLTIANGSTTSLSDNATVQNDLTVASGGSLALEAHNLSVEGTVLNHGVLAQTLTIDAASTNFLNIKDSAGSADKYLGVTVDPGAANMGSTTVSIMGNQLCSTASQGVLRCFEIDPTTAQPASVTFYYTEAERNNIESSSMLVYHWNGASWGKELGTTTRGEAVTVNG